MINDFRCRCPSIRYAGRYCDIDLLNLPGSRSFPSVSVIDNALGIIKNTEHVIITIIKITTITWLHTTVIMLSVIVLTRGFYMRSYGTAHWMPFLILYNIFNIFQLNLEMKS